MSSPFVSCEISFARVMGPKVTRVAHITVHVHLLAVRADDKVLAVLLGDALGALFECAGGIFGPPVAQAACHVSYDSNADRYRAWWLTVLIILAAAVVKRMRELMGSYGTEGAVLQVAGPFLRVERRLEDAGREDDLAIRRS